MSSVSGSSPYHLRKKNLFEKKSQAELRNLEERHQQIKKDQVESQKAELRNLKSEHQTDILNAQKNKEERLLKLRESLDKTDSFTKERIRGLKQDLTRKEARENAVSAQKINDIHFKHRQQVLEENDRFNDTMSELQSKNDSNTQDLRDKFKADLRGQRKSNSAIIEKERIGFQNNYKTEKKSFEHAIDSQREQAHRKIVNKERENQLKLQKLTTKNAKIISNNQEDFQVKTKKQQKSFEKAYEDKYQSQVKAIKNLEKQKLVFEDKIRKDLLNKTDIIYEKSQDPFYDFVEIDPTLEETKDSLIVKIKVPEHLKDKVIVNPRRKELNISLARNHEDTQDNGKGFSRKVNRFETAVTTIPLDFFVDGKKVEKSYQDNELTFKIKKA